MGEHPSHNRPLRVLGVGLGVVGLPLVRMLCQAGHHVTAIDQDHVTVKNLGKCFYSHFQVGLRKVDAAGQLVWMHNPQAGYTGMFADVRSLGCGVFAAFDLVVAGPDNRGTDRYVAERANLVGLPFIRLGTMGSERKATVRIVPPPSGPADACGACIFTADDHAIADTMASCDTDQAYLPEAGRLTFAQHGKIAASLAAEAIFAREFHPARKITYVGGPFPTLRTSRFGQSGRCRSSDRRRGHGPLEWEVIDEAVDSFTLGAWFDLAESRLEAYKERIVVEFDGAFCPGPRCVTDGCLEPVPARFWDHADPPGGCPVCGGNVRQGFEPERHRIPLREVEVRLDIPLARLRAPLGLGARFRGPKGRAWASHLIWNQPWAKEPQHDPSA